LPTGTVMEDVESERVKVGAGHVEPEIELEPVHQVRRLHVPEGKIHRVDPKFAS
jgi:hypothetical protein